MTNVVQIQRKLISSRAQPFLLRASSLSLVYSQDSEGTRPKGGVLPRNAARKLGDFPTCISERWCPRHREHTAKSTEFDILPD